MLSCTHIHINMNFHIYIYLHIYMTGFLTNHVPRTRTHEGGVHMSQTCYRDNTYMYTYSYSYTYSYTYTYTCTYTYTYTYTYTNIPKCVYTYVHIRTYTFTFTYICAYIYVYILHTWWDLSRTTTHEQGHLKASARETRRRHH